MASAPHDDHRIVEGGTAADRFAEVTKSTAHGGAHLAKGEHAVRRFTDHEGTSYVEHSGRRFKHDRYRDTWADIGPA